MMTNTKRPLPDNWLHPRCPEHKIEATEMVPEWDSTPPPIDAREYRALRCEQKDERGAPCRYEVKRKPDGSQCRDPRWTELMTPEGGD